MDLQAGTAQQLVLSVNNSSNWTGQQNVTFTLNSSFQTFSHTFNLYNTGRLNFHFTLASPGVPSVPAGTVLPRNLRATGGASSGVTISAPLTVQGSVTCTSLTQTSDESIKNNIREVPSRDITTLFNAVDPKLYERTDGVPGTRIGFVAQDIQAALPKDHSLDMLTPGIYTNGPPLLGVDYSRLSAVLWAQTKLQQQAIVALTTRVAALESRG